MEIQDELKYYNDNQFNVDFYRDLMSDVIMYLIYLRKKEKITQKELAARAEVSAKTVSLIESLQIYPRHDTVCKLAVALNSSVQKLFWMTNSNENYYGIYRTFWKNGVKYYLYF